MKQVDQHHVVARCAGADVGARIGLVADHALCIRNRNSAAPTAMTPDRFRRLRPRAPSRASRDGTMPAPRPTSARVQLRLIGRRRPMLPAHSIKRNRALIRINRVLDQAVMEIQPQESAVGVASLAGSDGPNSELGCPLFSTVGPLKATGRASGVAVPLRCQQRRAGYCGNAAGGHGCRGRPSPVFDDAAASDNAPSSSRHQSAVAV